MIVAGEGGGREAERIAAARPDRGLPPESRPDPAGVDREARRLWAALLAGPAAWLVALQLDYLLVPPACGAGPAPLVGVLLACAAAALAGAGGGFREWKALGRGAEDDGAGPPDRSRFMAIVAMAMGVFFALLILTSLLPVALLDPCWT